MAKKHPTPESALAQAAKATTESHDLVNSPRGYDPQKGRDLLEVADRWLSIARLAEQLVR